MNIFLATTNLTGTRGIWSETLPPRAFATMDEAVAYVESLLPHTHNGCTIYITEATLGSTDEPTTVAHTRLSWDEEARTHSLYLVIN